MGVSIGLAPTRCWRGFPVGLLHRRSHHCQWRRGPTHAEPHLCGVRVRHGLFHLSCGRGLDGGAADGSQLRRPWATSTGIRLSCNYFDHQKCRYCMSSFSNCSSTVFIVAQNCKTTKLVFTTIQNYAVRASNYSGKKNTGKTCSTTVIICSVVFTTGKINS